MIIENYERIGNFTSSKIFNLTKKDRAGTGFGVPALTYIKNKSREQRAMRSLENEAWSKEMSWGNFLEPYIHKKLGSDYHLMSDVTDVHPTIKRWVGSKDSIKFDEGCTVVDIKAPFTLSSYFDFVEADGDIDKFRELHTSGDQYYYQLVSNAIINNCKYAELIAYVPQQIELIDLRLIVGYEEGNEYNWIARSEDRQLPYLPAESKVPNMTIIRFEVPQKDIDFLTERVLLANELIKTL